MYTINFIFFKMHNNDSDRFYPIDVKIISNHFIIHQLLFTNTDAGGTRQPKRAFFVHTSVYPKVRKVLNFFGINFQRHVWNYTLQIGAKSYDMKLIFLTKAWLEIDVIMFNLMKYSPFSLAGEKHFTLFRDKRRLYQLMEFLKRENLENFIIKIKTKPGVNSEDQWIKVVTFNNEINPIAVTKNFHNYLKMKATVNEPPDIFHYYITYAFPWLQPQRLSHFRNPIKNYQAYFGVFTFLTCMRELSYDKEPHLNIYDLCSLKLALCDFRNTQPISQDLDFEIDALIIRSLKRMIRNKTYIRNKHFNLEQYAIDSDNIPRRMHIWYTQYHFQEYFKANISFTNTFILSDNGSPNTLHLHVTMRLIEYSDPVKILHARPNVHFQIDGTYYKHMDFELFLAILRCPNVGDIKLDTNYEWNLNKKITPPGVYEFGRFPIRIWLNGSNRYNFIEEFISSVKIITDSLYIELFINSPLNNYSVLKEFRIAALTFLDIHITIDLLDRLFANNRLVQYIRFNNCSVENNFNIWSKLNIEYPDCVFAREDEYTWQTIFEYAAFVLRTNRNIESGYIFRGNIWVSSYDHAIHVDVGKIKFMINPMATKLELIDIKRDQPIDLYYLKNSKTLPPDDDKSVYDFYQ